MDNTASNKSLLTVVVLFTALVFSPSALAVWSTEVTGAFSFNPADYYAYVEVADIRQCDYGSGQVNCTGSHESNIGSYVFQQANSSYYTVSNGGTSLAWGNPQVLGQSSLTFAGASDDLATPVTTGDLINLGSFSLSNVPTQPGSELAKFGFDITVNLYDGASNDPGRILSQSWTFDNFQSQVLNISVDSTLNTADPIASADGICSESYVPINPANPADGYTNYATSCAYVQENSPPGDFLLSAYLGSIWMSTYVPLSDGSFTRNTFPDYTSEIVFPTAVSVPEPDTLAMALLGVGILGFSRFRKQSAGIG